VSRVQCLNRIAPTSSTPKLSFDLAFDRFALLLTFEAMAVGDSLWVSSVSSVSLSLARCPALDFDFLKRSSAMESA